jgi:FMN reductase
MTAARMREMLVVNHWHRAGSEHPMTMRAIIVVSAGLSQPSSTRLLADRLAAATARRLPGETQVSTIELRELAHDITSNLLTGFASPALRRAMDQLLCADGLIAVTPLYRGSYNALFKSFFDVLDPDALTGKPVLIAATGATARHSLALEHAIQPLFSYLRAVTVPTAVFAVTEDWGSARDSASAFTARIERAASKLAAAIGQRQPQAEADPYRSVTRSSTCSGDAERAAPAAPHRSLTRVASLPTTVFATARDICTSAPPSGSNGRTALSA